MKPQALKALLIHLFCDKEKEKVAGFQEHKKESQVLRVEEK